MLGPRVRRFLASQQAVYLSKLLEISLMFFDTRAPHVQPFRLTLIAAVSLVTLAGCGGGSTSATPFVTTLAPLTWTLAAAAPAPAQIVGGPWNLTQLASGNTSVKPQAPFLTSGSGVKVSWNFWDSVQRLLGTNSTSTAVNMQPFYFPHVTTVDGNTLYGFFDYRAKDLNESLVAAKSTDGGLNWSFMQQGLSRWTPTTNIAAYGVNTTMSSVTANQTYAGPAYDPSAKINVDVTQSTTPSQTTYTNQWGDDGTGSVTNNVRTLAALDGDVGYGHTNLVTVGNITRMYMLDRDYRTPASLPAAKASAIDNLGLIVFPVPSLGAPLSGLPGSVAVQDINGNYSPYTPLRTTGLINPDGIMAVLPGASPTTILYVSKIKGGDNTGATALPTAQQCSTQPYNATGTSAPKKANHDFVTIRIATTTNGIDFVDKGAVGGLNDPTTVDYSQIRYTAPNGSLFDLGNGHYGLLFAGGNCMDADSDGFHIIGYAENVNANDLTQWKVLNGIDSPIASIESKTFINAATGKSETHPATVPVVGVAQPWFAGRVYSPSAVRLASGTVSMTFSGYGVQSPNTDLLNYRQIGNVMLKPSAAVPAQLQQ